MANLKSNLTSIRYCPSVDGLDGENEFFPKMPDFSKNWYYIKKEKAFFGKKQKLDLGLMGLHVGYRKGMDSIPSAIVWNCLSVMKSNHVELLLDTMDNILPKTMNPDNEHDNKIFNDRMMEMWQLYFDRLSGYIIAPKDDIKKTRGWEHRIHEGFKQYNELYRVVMSNLESALKIQHDTDPNSYEHFPQFMYYKEEKK